VPTEFARAEKDFVLHSRKSLC